MIRTILDSVLALMALIALSPLLAAIALAVCIDSAGSPIYLAWRVGRLGRPFRMFKFRTMVVNAALAGPPVTGNNDPRVTRVGRFLRGTKLDELPQFLNVVMGDMSLVGPRPEAPEMVALYSPEQRRVLAAKPGMTGKVQIQGHEAETIPENQRADEYYVQHLMEHKLNADIEYLKHRTIFTDTQILLETAVFVVRSFARK